MKLFKIFLLSLCCAGIAFAATPHVFNSGLMLGSSGADVKALQKFLNMAGFPVAEQGPGSRHSETSYFGLSTQKALTQFQTVNGLPPDGRLSSTTQSVINSLQIKMNIIATSSNAIFSYPHGVTMIGDTMVIGTVKENPGHIVIFTNPNDLTKYIATTTPGFMNLADVDYDAAHNKLYFVSSRTSNNHLEILSVDPNTLAWMPVFEFTGVSGVGYSTLETDGSYVYAATQSVPAYMLKIRISDWSLAGSHVFPSGPSFHSSALHKYSNRTEWYVATFSEPTYIYKVRTDDFSYTSLKIPQSAYITNDIYFRPVDDAGGLLYAPSETNFGIDVVNTATMTAVHYPAPASYGLFSDGNDIYSLDPFNHQIIQYAGFNIQKPIFVQSKVRYQFNKWFKTSNGNTYFTPFSSPSALYQYSAGR